MSLPPGLQLFSAGRFLLPLLRAFMEQRFDSFSEQGMSFLASAYGPAFA
jgi:hypothetical protein